MQVSVTSHRDPEPLSLDAFERLGLFVLGREDVPDQAELSIAIVDEEEMTSLNQAYRGVAGPTDVLSFACDDPGLVETDQPITLGDVVIAPSVAERNAAELASTVEAELNLLLIHGILHLLGYAHGGDEQGDAMQARERALLEAYADAT